MTNISFLKEQLRKHVLIVHYYKVSGERAEMRCTLRPDLLPDELSTVKRHVSGSSQVRVFNLDKQDWRSFLVQNVITYNIEPEAKPETVKYRVGDEVWVKGTITSIGNNSEDFDVKFDYSGNCNWWHQLWVDSKIIVKHIPAPRPIIVGSKVRIFNGITGDVKAISNSEAWVKTDNDANIVMSINSMSLID